MVVFEELKKILREKSGKKLALLSVTAFLLITVLVFFAVFTLYENVHREKLDRVLGEIPKTIDSIREELSRRNRVCEEDMLVRAELGLKIYREEIGLTDAEKLEKIRSMVSAASVSLLDGQRQLLSTTGPVSPEENLRTCIQTLEPRTLHLEFYPALTEDGKETGVNDGKEFLLLPIPGNTKQSLVFEFSCEPLLKLYNDSEDWSEIFARVLAGEDAIAFAKAGGKIASYPEDTFAPEQTPKLNEELTAIFKNNDVFKSEEYGKSSKHITLLGRRYFATLMHYPQENTDILLMFPLIDVIRNGIFIAAAISIIIGWGIVLFQIYAYRRLIRKKAGEETDKVSPEQAYRMTWPGIAAVLAVTVIFSLMLLLLEGRSNASSAAMVRRLGVETEIAWSKTQENTIRSTYMDIYRTRTQMLTAYLKEHPDYQTREGLKELSSMAGTEYLMRFDGTGQELFSSNGYAGFSVGTNLSEEYRAVLMGYPYAVVGPAADPYTGKMQIGTAILMTDSEDQPDGFLLAVYNSENLATELKQIKYENIVNNYLVQNGQVVAVINNEDGCFIAHTDKDMIGLKAAEFLENIEPGNSFEGLAVYKKKSMYVSASSTDGKTLVFMVPEREDSYTKALSVPAILAVLFILGLVYFPLAGVLIARATDEAKDDPQPSAGTAKSRMILCEGYAIYLTLFVIFALIASASGWWTSFDYVFSGQWSKGVNLFSLWAALFTLAVTLFITFLVRAVLRRVEGRLSLQSRTITRMAGSLVSYAACIFLFFDILDMFGVNTTVLLASAGVVSIAVGMGAKSMASDLLAGFFMMIEGSVHVGDYVYVSKVKGHVTDMGIRTTKITDEEGNVIILNNSKVNPVFNMNKSCAQQATQSDPKNDAADDSDDSDDGDDDDNDD